MSLPLYKPADQCRYDVLSLGEVMLRLDPGEGRIHTARSFRAWEGGGEYNVARGLRRCFGLRAAVVTAFADNPVGRLVEDFILQGGVDVSLIRWMPYDGIGRTVRNGLNFTERGFGIRGAKGCSDRGNTAVSQVVQSHLHAPHPGTTHKITAGEQYCNLRLDLVHRQRILLPLGNMNRHLIFLLYKQIQNIQKAKPYQLLSGSWVENK